MKPEAAFKKMSRNERYNALREEGTYVGGRIHGGHSIYLYTWRGLYVELYMRTGLNCVDWIEIQRNKAIISEYADNVDLKDLF